MWNNTFPTNVSARSFDYTCSPPVVLHGLVAVAQRYPTVLVLFPSLRIILPSNQNFKVVMFRSPTHNTLDTVPRSYKESVISNRGGIWIYIERRTILTLLALSSLALAVVEFPQCSRHARRSERTDVCLDDEVE